MHYKANEARRHRIPRARYRVTNWPDYDRALQRRGSLTVWVTPEALAGWHPPNTGRRGRSRHYSGDYQKFRVGPHRSGDSEAVLEQDGELRLGRVPLPL